jgi:hypothetical protein
VVAPPRMLGKWVGNGRTIDAIQRLEHVAGNCHQGPGIARRHRRRRRSVLDLLDGNAHGRILFAAQSNLKGIVHGHHFAGGHQGCTLMGKTLQSLGQPHHQQSRPWVALQEMAACRQRDMGAMVAAHAVNSQCDHGMEFWPPARPVDTK